MSTGMFSADKCQYCNITLMNALQDKVLQHYNPWGRHLLASPSRRETLALWRNRLLSWYSDDTLAQHDERQEDAKRLHTAYACHAC